MNAFILILASAIPPAAEQATTRQPGGFETSGAVDAAYWNQPRYPGWHDGQTWKPFQSGRVDDQGRVWFD